LLDRIYAGAARWRRRSAEQHPERQRRLTQPVISVGNLSVGGTGKTPVVAELARWLVARGERPAILSRGYGRTDRPPGAVVVSDGTSILAPLARAGDEPLMLARGVPGAIVCVSSSRYLAGVVAERRLGATVHLLDDGFQHLALARNLDVLVTTVGEIPTGRVIPRGRLREPAGAAARAHVLVVMGAAADAANAEAWTLGVSLACGASRVIGEPRGIGTRREGDGRGDRDGRDHDGRDHGGRDHGGRDHGGRGDHDGRGDRDGSDHDGSRTTLPRDARVAAVCGIANPARFFDDLRAVGWNVVAERTFPDHHAYDARDVQALARLVADSGAQGVLTTEKDAVRFEPWSLLPFPLYAVPTALQFDPPDVLVDTVDAALAASRTGRGPG
jgi:tetraacyldisaccharide 4'-kinase